MDNIPYKKNIILNLYNRTGGFGMGLQLILGGSGSGKSTTMYKELVSESRTNANVHYLAIVPEQFTMETQKMIVMLSPEHGSMAIDILSFDRLARRIFEEAGLNALQVLDDTGKCLIIRKIIEENKRELTVFGSKVKMAGFVEEMKSMISELFQYGIGEKELADILVKSQNKPLLYAKLTDIQIILVKLKEYLNDRFVMNEEILTRVCALIPDSEMIRNSVITFDEYTGFSPVQFEVIRALLKYARKVTVTVTIRNPEKVDYTRNNPNQIFYLGIKTVSKLLKLAQDENIQIEENIVMKNGYRFQKSQTFKYLEQNLFQYGKRSYEEPVEDMSIHICNNVISEAEYVAATIADIVKNKQYRYRDIAVITPDIESYYRGITEVFGKYNIPCFIDYKHSIITNPMVEMLRAILELVTDNYSYESVFRYLRSGMSSLTEEEIDILENHVIQYGIRGYKRWSQPFRTQNDSINEAREKVLSDTEELYNQLKRKEDKTVSDIINTLYQLCIKLDVEGKLQKLQDIFLNENKLALAKEYDQTYDKVVTLFEKTVFLIGDEIIKVKEILPILDSGFEDIKVGIVPPTLDRLVVGNLERTRLNNVKVLFLIGINDGLIPKAKSDGGVLSQSDRSFLQENDVELSPTNRESVFIQKYYLYLMLTKMSERLYLSFKRINSDGSSARQSYLINTIKNMFPKIAVIDEDKEENSQNRIVNEKLAKTYIAENMFDYIHESLPEEKVKQFREIYAKLLRENIGISKIIEAAIYQNQDSKIEEAIAKAIYGENLHNSVSRLETFAACAYKHFIMYGLALMNRQEYQVNSADIGSIYHSTIEHFSKKVTKRNINWGIMDEELRNQLINESLNEVVEEYADTAFQDNARNAYMIERIRKMATKTAWVLQQQVIAGKFIPGDFEIKFSSEYGLDELKYIYPDGAQMGVRGVIDRVDYFHDGDDIYIKIVDYKSGPKKLEINDVYHGLQLQLVLYMEAAMELTKKKNPGKNVIPAGLFYYNIDNPVIDEEQINVTGIDSAEEKEAYSNAMKKCAEDEVLKLQRVDGFVNAGEKVLRAMDENLEEAAHSGGESLVIPIAYTKKGTFKSNSKQITQLEMEKLIQFVHEKVGKLGSDILEGKIDLDPYVKVNGNGNAMSGKTSCEYCEYNAICGFDPKMEGCQYRILQKKDNEDIWKEIIKAGGVEGGKVDTGAEESH